MPPNLVAIAVVGGFIYFIPSMIAIVRLKKGVLGVIALNVLLGWTAVGWIISFVWALS